MSGQRLLYSLKLKDWNLALQRSREIEIGGIGASSEPVLVQRAIDKFLLDIETRQLGKNNQRKFKHLLQLLKQFCEGSGLIFLSQLSPDETRNFRNTWKLSPSTAAKELERLKTFLNFCTECDWLDKNPAKVLKPPKVEPTQIVPFTDEQLTKLWKTCDGYRKNSRDGDGHRLKLLGQLMLATGLRIGDASVITRDKFIRTPEGYEIRLRTAKTRVDVQCPIQNDLAKAILGLDGPHPFWSGQSSVDDNSGMWRKRFGRLFKKANITGHCHMFRHTFITRLLVAGVSVENTAALAGNSPAIIRKHYSAWTKERQQALGDAVRKTWA